MKVLNGKVIAVMGKGRIDNRYIEMLGANLSSSIFRILNPFDDKDPCTAFNCFVSRFDITKPPPGIKGVVEGAGRRLKRIFNP